MKSMLSGSYQKETSMKDLHIAKNRSTNAHRRQDSPPRDAARSVAGRLVLLIAGLAVNACAPASDEADKSSSGSEPADLQEGALASTGTWFCDSPHNRPQSGIVHGYDHYDFTIGPISWCASYQTFVDPDGYLFGQGLVGNSMKIKNNTPLGPLSGIYLYKITYTNRWGEVAEATPNDLLGPSLDSGQQATIHVDTRGWVDKVITPDGTTNWSTKGESNAYGPLFLAGIRTIYIPTITFWFTDKDAFRYAVYKYLL